MHSLAVMRRMACRAADLGASPTSTEDSDAIPGTDRKVQQQATSAKPKASKRHLAFCKLLA